MADVMDILELDREPVNLESISDIKKVSDFRFMHKQSINLIISF